MLSSSGPKPDTVARTGTPLPMPPRAKYSVTDAVGCQSCPIAACAREELLARLARGRDAREVALDVGGEDRDALGRQLLGEPLQRARLARSGGTGDEPVAVHHRERDADLRVRDGIAVDERAEVEGRRLERVARDDGGHLVGVERAAHRSRLRPPAVPSRRGP